MVVTWVPGRSAAVKVSTDVGYVTELWRARLESKTNEPPTFRFSGGQPCRSLARGEGYRHAADVSDQSDVTQITTQIAY
jgi:hypothetical protein